MNTYLNKIKKINPLYVPKAVAEIHILTTDFCEDLECLKKDDMYSIYASLLQKKIYKTMTTIHKIIAQNKGMVKNLTMQYYIKVLKTSDKILNSIIEYCKANSELNVQDFSEKIADDTKEFDSIFTYKYLN